MIEPCKIKRGGGGAQRNGRLGDRGPEGCCDLWGEFLLESQWEGKRAVRKTIKNPGGVLFVIFCNAS